VNLVTRQIELGFSASVRKLGPILRRMRAPAVATALTGRGVVSGTLDVPKVSASVSAEGVPMTGRADARIDYQPGELRVKELRADPLGGELIAGGRFTLGPRVGLEGVFVSAGGLLLDQIPGMKGVLAGTLDIEVTAGGRLPHPRATLTASVKGLRVSGEPLGSLDAELHTGEEGIGVDRLVLGDAERAASLTGRVGWDGELDLHLDAQKIPIASLPFLAKDPGLGADGTASLELDVRGTRAAPELGGTLKLAGVAFGQTIFGGGRLHLEPGAPGEVRFAGTLFQGKFVVDGNALLRPPYHATLRIDFRRVEIDEFTTVAAVLGASGWASGHVEIRVRDRMEYTLHVDELQAQVEGTDERGRPTPVVVTALEPIDVEYRNGVARFVKPVRLATPEGQFTIAGFAGEQAIDLTVDGEVQLGLLHAFTHRYLDRVAGVAKAKVSIKGTAAAPLLDGRHTLAKVVVVPRGTEAELGVPQGAVTLRNNRVGIDELTLAVDDHKLTLNGSVTLAAWQPSQLDLRLRGRLAARLFEVIAGAQVSGSSGSAGIAVNVTGTPQSPAIDGQLVFDAPFELTLRALRRQITVQRGKVAFRNNRLDITNLGGAVDDGRFQLGGFVRLQNWKFAETDMRASLDGVRFAVPQVLYLESNADLQLRGDTRQLYLSGNIEVVDGRYTQSFKIADVLLPERSTDRSAPFWAGVPLLERLNLALQLRTNGEFGVNNNIAQEMSLTGSVSITGTPPDPRLSGRITVEQGRIKIPGFKPVWDVETGNVLFDPYQRALPGTKVSITARAPYTDREEREHEVTLTIDGPLTGLVINMFTNTGLNFAQTAVMISTNRTQDELRQQARGDSESVVKDGSSTTGQLGDSGGDGVLSEADRLIKDVVGNVVSVVIEDPLKRTFPIDCVRLEVGTESALFYTCKRLGRGVKVDGDLEYGYQGSTRYRGGLNARVNNSLSFIMDIEQTINSDDETQNDTRGRIELKWRFILP
jgi:autotransporter translocation and assembly factor TamB